MEYQEFTGDNVNLAINEACAVLMVPSSELEYEIISKESAGFLGFGKKPARIRARKKETISVEEEIFREAKPAPKYKKVKEEKTPVQKKPQAPAAEKKPAEVKPAEVKKEVKKEVKAAAPAVKEPVKEKPVVPETKQENAAAETPAKKEEKRGEFRKERRRPDQKQRPKKNFERKNNREQENAPVQEKEPVQKPAAVKPAEPKPEPVKVPRTEEEIEVFRQAATKFLTEVFAAMEITAEINVNYSEESGNLEIDFAGEDMGILIGKRGQTLDSLQYLTSLVVNKGESPYIRVKLDTENYRSRRKDTLENLAKNIAFRVKKTRKPVSLEPMNPYERRIIHSALQNNKFVETYSEGNEPYRHVVVTYKKNPKFDREREFKGGKGRRDYKRKPENREPREAKETQAPAAAEE